VQLSYNSSLYAYFKFADYITSAKLGLQEVVATVNEGEGGGGPCVLKFGFKRTFLRNLDRTVKLKSELIFIKF
jgi:hypothetical protein